MFIFNIRKERKHYQENCSICYQLYVKELQSKLLLCLQSVSFTMKFFFTNNSLIQLYYFGSPKRKLFAFCMGRQVCFLEKDRLFPLLFFGYL